MIHNYDPSLKNSEIESRNMTSIYFQFHQIKKHDLFPNEVHFPLYDEKRQKVPL